MKRERLNFASFVIGALLMAGPLLAYGSSYPASWGMAGQVGKWGTDATATIAYDTALAVCKSYNGTWIVHGSTTPENWSVKHHCASSNGNPQTAGAWRTAFCPYGGTISGVVNSGGPFTCINAPPCPNGQVRNSTTGQCEPPPCQQGQVSTERYYVGHALTALYISDWLNPTYPTSSCVGQCAVSVGSIDDQSCGVDDSGPAPYPGFCTFNVTTTGQTCTQSPGDAQTTAPPAVCPIGTAEGQVNGVSGCYPVSTTTSNTNTTPNPDGSTTKTTTTTNADGSTTTTTTTTSADGTTSSTTTTTTPPTGNGGGGGGTPAPESVKNDLCASDPSKCVKAGDFAGPPTTGLYEKDTARSFGKSLTDFRGKVTNSQLGGAVTNYFAVSTGGSCPTWSATIPYLSTTLVIDHFCSPAALVMLQIAGAALMVLAGWAAFRIAIL